MAAAATARIPSTTARIIRPLLTGVFAAGVGAAGAFGGGTGAAGSADDGAFATVQIPRCVVALRDDISGITINTDQKSVDDVVSEILNALKYLTNL